MVRLPSDWNPEAPGSRFTMRVALALPAGEEFALRAETDDASVGREVVDAALDVEAQRNGPLGEVRVVGGSLGRGAAGWCAVAEWAFDAAGKGAVAGVTWMTVQVGARWLRDQIRCLRSREQVVLVSRGAAVLLAMAYVLDEEGEGSGPLELEAAEDPVTMSGAEPTEMNYTGIEPWLVSLVNESRTQRYVVAISAHGEPLSLMSMRMTEAERFYAGR